MSLTATAPIELPHTSPRWAPLQRWVFRVAFIYFILDALPDLLMRLPGGPFMLRLYWYPWNAILPWMGAHILHVDDPGSLALPTVPVLLGDFTGAYLLMLLFLLLAVCVATVWTALDRGRTDDRVLHGWLRVYVRYALAFSMMGYGISKLFHVQFRELDLLDWMTPLGMLQPRELLWDFMGFSRTYQIFTGVVECLGTALVLFRRTTLLGASVLAASMANVLVMDIAYGVSVRRIALRLLLLSAFLIAADIRRVVNMFLLNRSTGPANLDVPRWDHPVMRRVAIGIKTLVLGVVLASRGIDFYRERAVIAAPRPALYGVFSVQRAAVEGNALGELHRWVWVAFDGRGFAVAGADATWQRRRATFDDANHKITVSGASRSKEVLTYSREGETVTIAGTLDQRQMEVVLRRLTTPRFVLVPPAETR